MKINIPLFLDDNVSIIDRFLHRKILLDRFKILKRYEEIVTSFARLGVINVGSCYYSDVFVTCVEPLYPFIIIK